MGESLVIRGVYMSESEILRAVLERFRQSGLVCKPTQQKLGAATTSGAVLLSSGDVGVGGGTSNIERQVWNPFTVRQREGDWWETRITVSEVTRYLRNFGETTYEGRDIRIVREAYVRDEFSGIGCVLGMIPCLLLTIVGWATGHFFYGALFGMGAFGLIHWIVKGIVRLVVGANTKERDNLFRKVDEVLSGLSYELGNEPQH